ncbi:MAG: gamma-glutamylcyclotransferase family protein [Chitinophagaceae bacterium]
MEFANHQLFVYGSLRSGFNHPAYAYISTHFALVGSAKVKGKLYDLGSYPAALPTDDETYILGELYRLKEEQDFSWAIAQVDDYEGVNPEPGETALYTRQKTTVYIDGQTTSAWIYWYNNDIAGKPLIASGDVLEYLQQKKS